MECQQKQEKEGKDNVWMDWCCHGPNSTVLPWTGGIWITCISPKLFQVMNLQYPMGHTHIRKTERCTMSLCISVSTINPVLSGNGKGGHGHRAEKDPPTSTYVENRGWPVRPTHPVILHPLQNCFAGIVFYSFCGHCNNKCLHPALWYQHFLF